MSASILPAEAYSIRGLSVSGLLRSRVKALVGVELKAGGPIPLAIAPHDAWMLSVQTGRGVDGAERKNPLGANTALTGVRRRTGAFEGAGDCTTLFALLTPLGVVELLQARALGEAPRIRASVRELLDADTTVSLESAIAGCDALDDKLRAMAGWLEARAERPLGRSRAASRAARAAMVLAERPHASVEAAADAVHVCRRQLERDFGRFLATTPRHWSRVVRVQAVSRHVARGAGLAAVAAELGFTDQSHMTNEVRQLTGLTPTRYLRAANGPLGVAFRRCTGGGTVYL